MATQRNTHTPNLEEGVPHHFNGSIRDERTNTRPSYSDTYLKYIKTNDEAPTDPETESLHVPLHDLHSNPCPPGEKPHDGFPQFFGPRTHLGITRIEHASDILLMVSKD